MSLKRMTVIGLSLVSLAIGSAGNAANLVKNGDFSNLTTTNTYLPSSGLTDWMYINPLQNGVAYIYGPGGADANPAIAVIGLWGPNNGGPTTTAANGGLPILPSTCPGCGNYVASDGDPGFSHALFQSVALTANQTYLLTFDYAAAQFRRNFGPTAGLEWNGASETTWQVTLAGTVLTDMNSPMVQLDCPTLTPCGAIGGALEQATTPVLSIVSNGFSGWREESITFRAPTSGTEILSFFALGAPNGLPPAALLGNVVLAAVPEPATLSLISVGILGLGVAGLRRRTKRSAEV
jgi:hypothetical protein